MRAPLAPSSVCQGAVMRSIRSPRPTLPPSEALSASTSARVRLPSWLPSSRRTRLGMARTTAASGPVEPSSVRLAAMMSVIVGGRMCGG